MKRFLANSSNAKKKKLSSGFESRLHFTNRWGKNRSTNLDKSLSSSSHNSLTTYIRVNGWRLILMTERHILCHSRDVWNITVTMTRHSSEIFSATKTGLPLVVKKFTFTCQNYFRRLTVEKRFFIYWAHYYWKSVHIYQAIRVCYSLYTNKFRSESYTFYFTMFVYDIRRKVCYIKDVAPCSLTHNFFYCIVKYNSVALSGKMLLDMEICTTQAYVTEFSQGKNCSSFAQCLRKRDSESEPS